MSPYSGHHHLESDNTQSSEKNPNAFFNTQYNPNYQQPSVPYPSDHRIQNTQQPPPYFQSNLTPQQFSNIPFQSQHQPSPQEHPPTIPTYSQPSQTTSPPLSFVPGNNQNQPFFFESEPAKQALEIFSMVSGNHPTYNQHKMWSWINWPLQTLKPYFQDWNRKTISSQENSNHIPGTMLVNNTHHGFQYAPQPSTSSSLNISFAVPREDICSPDLYIPVHAFITYVILVSIVYGIDGKFTPDILGVTSSSALLTSLLELLVVRTGFFLLGIGSSIPIVEYVAFVGYKYVGLVAIVTSGLLAPTATLLVTRIVWVYVSIAYCFFSLRSLKDILNLSPAFGDISTRGSILPGGHNIEDGIQVNPQRRHLFFLLLVAFFQAAVSYYLIIEPKLLPGTPLGP